MSDPFSCRTRRFATAVLAVYFVLWVILPYELSASYPFDVPEGIYWGREWQWGYYKHPPFSSWVLFSFYKIFGHIGPYIASQAMIVLTLWAVYLLGCRVAGKQRAVAAVFLTMGVFYCTWPSLEFNHNLAQMPVWAWLIFLFYLAVMEKQWWQWLLFGLLAGIGMLTKYPVAVLLLTMVLYSLITPHRRLWRTAGPWAALLLAFVVFAPNLYWLSVHDWLPFTYAAGRAVEAETRDGRLGALSFLLTQILAHLPLLLILLCTRTRIKPARPISPALFFVLFLGIMPALLLAAAGLVTGVGLRDMWGMPMWTMSGLMAVMCIPDRVFERNFQALLKGSAVWLVLATVLMAVYVEAGGRIRHKPARTDWPQAALAAEAQATWRKVSTCPADSITGNDWLAILAASYMPDAPSVMISGPAVLSPWMSPERLREHGSLAVWEAGKKPPLPLFDRMAHMPGLKEAHGTWQFSWEKVPGKAPLQVYWQAYVPENCAVTP